MEKQSLLDAERKFIHLLLTGKIPPSQIQSEFPPEIFDPHHHLLVKSIYAEFADNGQTLTRNRYSQQLLAAGAGGDLMQNLTVFDKCYVGVFANPEDVGELKEQVLENHAGSQLFALTETIRKNQKFGWRRALEASKKVLSDGLVAGQSLEIVTLSDVVEEEVQWLWENRVAVGKLTLFIGDPCCGKSFVTLNMAARISKGLPLPGSNVSTVKGDTIILSSEDGVADTIVKRYRLQGGELARVHVVKCSGGKVFSIETDLPLLESALKQFPETRMIVVDPLNAYLGKADAYKEAEVRRVLTPLCDFAERNKIAIVGIQHLTKTNKGAAMYRGLGSIAFAAAARAVWAFCRDAEDEDRRLMLEVKNNLGPSPGAYLIA